MSASLPLAILDPHPRRREMLFDDVLWKRLNSLLHIEEHEEERMPSDMVDRLIEDASIVIGQTDMPAERLQRARNLKAIINVEGNFLQNIDYDICFQRGIHVLAIAPAFALPVAEMALGLALDAARGITSADRLFRQGKEKFGLSGNQGSFLLTDASIGMVGFGNLGRALLPLLAPFRAKVKVFDPWLPDGHLREMGVMPTSLDDVLATSQLVFLLAGVTSENEGMIGARELALMPDGGAVVLMSRAGLVDWDAFLEAASSGRIRAATDVFPEEPVAPDDPVRNEMNIILSAHRAGGLHQIFRKIGEMVTDDIDLVLRGLPPVRLQQARRETVSRMRSIPGRSYSKDELK